MGYGNRATGSAVVAPLVGYGRPLNALDKAVFLLACTTSMDKDDYPPMIWLSIPRILEKLAKDGWDFDPANPKDHQRIKESQRRLVDAGLFTPIVRHKDDDRNTTKIEYPPRDWEHPNGRQSLAHKGKAAEFAVNVNGAVRSTWTDKPKREITRRPIKKATTAQVETEVPVATPNQPAAPVAEFAVLPQRHDDLCGDDIGGGYGTWATRLADVHAPLPVKEAAV